MIQIFITVLNMSLTAAYCIIAVIIARFFLLRQPKLFSYLLWSVVLFRLLCPVALSGSYSLLRIDTNVISQENMMKQDPGNAEAENLNALHAYGMMIQDAETGQTDLRTGLSEEKMIAGENRMQKVIGIAAWVWFAGIILLIGYSIKAAYCLRRALEGAVLTQGNWYETETITTPFVFGIIRPRIYLPTHMREEDKKYVLLHEKIHIARKDYLVKILAYGAVCLHWFNPLVWLAFALMENDMEMSCDEAVLKKIGADMKKEYSMSLLSLSTKKTIFQGSPLAFGEGRVKSRVRNILLYRKRTFFAVVFAAVVIIAVGAGLFFNPAAVKEVSAEEKAIITGFVEKYADAHCGRDGSVIAVMYVDEETAVANEADRMLEKTGDGYTYGFSSPWPYSYRYEIDWEENKADIRYYAWTSDPHISVWREEIQYVKIGEEYRVNESSMQILNSISSAGEFEDAYWINGEYQFEDYIANGFAEAIAYQMENSTSFAIDNTVYGKPETAAAHILNLVGGEGRVEGDYTFQATVRYRFADGSEVMIPMYMPFAEEGEEIWIVDVDVWNAGAP